jgi:transposase-like protein
MSAPLRRAVEYAGGVTQLARTLGVSQQAVHKWLRRGWVSPDRAAELCGLYGIPAAELLRPELRRLLAITDSAAANVDLI